MTQKIVSIIILGTVIISLEFTLLTVAQEKQDDGDFVGRRANGAVITRRNLVSILEQHHRWLYKYGEEGKQADLRGANLELVNLEKAVLARANLKNAILKFANLERANLVEANLSGVSARNAKLSGSNLSMANLAQIVLFDADLQRANLRAANLRDAFLKGANLQLANLSEANLRNADLRDANLEGIEFIGATGLSTIKISKPEQVIDLRKIAKEYGLRNEEKAITSALRKYQLRTASAVDTFFQRFVFGGEITDYGANPWASLAFLGLLILPFSLFYIFPLTINMKRAGIYALIPKDSLFKRNIEQKPIKLTTKIYLRDHKGKIYRFFRVIRIAFYFSLLSAFSIGWRELNVGNWITRLQRKEYVLRASGWVRTVSGIQSLLSVYLLALWALTYFGRPFE